MATRRRARIGDEIVTILDATVPKSGQVKVRDSFGYVKMVPRRQLKLIAEDERGSVLKFGDDA